MKSELLALLPGRLDTSGIKGVGVVPVADFTAVFAPASAGFRIGKALRRARLAKASRRQEWLESLMEYGTVLACAPGTMIEKPALGALVKANAEMLAKLTDRLSERVQYQVTVHWDEETVLKRFRTDLEIAPLFAAEKVTAPAIAAAVARLSERLARRIQTQLGDAAEDMAELPRASGILSNNVLLIHRSQEAELAATLERIDAIWTDGFRIRQIGPSPAISFATLRLQTHRPKDIDQAFRTLEAVPPISAKTVLSQRQALLRRPGADAETIRAAARLALAACDVGDRSNDINLIDLWSEERAAVPGLDRVA